MPGHMPGHMPSLATAESSISETAERARRIPLCSVFALLEFATALKIAFRSRRLRYAASTTAYVRRHD